MAANGGTPTGVGGKSSPRQPGWQQQTPNFLNYSGLSGGLSVDALAGPMLFTPTPPMNPATTATPSSTTQPLSALGEPSHTLLQDTSRHLKHRILHRVNAVVYASRNNKSQPNTNSPSTKNATSELRTGSTIATQLQSATIEDFIQTGKQISPPLVNDMFGTSGSQRNSNIIGGSTSPVRQVYSPESALESVPLSSSASTASSLQMDTITPQSFQTLDTTGQRGGEFQNLNEATPHQPMTSNMPQLRQPIPSQPYTILPLVPHWFYLKGRKVWTPFSFSDSRQLETAFSKGDKAIVQTDGGRYDVDLSTSSKQSIFWEEEPSYVQRCTWFFKGDGGSKLIPYQREIAEILETEYQRVASTSSWNQKIQLPNGDYVHIHNANVIVYYTEGVDWTGEDSTRRPHIVRRGIADIKDDIPEGEPDHVDHLVFIVHGIGPVADLDFRPITECVDDMRQISLNLMRQQNFERGSAAGRVEFLPVKWYGSVHDDKTGVDRQLKSISLPSACKLREFTNDTLTDILFFTSPIYCQAISDTVVDEMNRLLALFKSRNPSFKGNVSLCGHSLGTCILFDIMAHQGDRQDVHDGEVGEDFVEVVEEVENFSPEQELTTEQPRSLPSSSGVTTPNETPSLDSMDGRERELPNIEDVLKKLGLTNILNKFQEEQMDTETLIMCTEADIKDLGIPMGPRKKLLGFIKETLAEQGKPPPKPRIDPVERITSKPEVVTGPIYNKGTQTLMSVRRHENDPPNSMSFPYFKGLAGTGQPCVAYGKLNFEPQHMFALGSPIGLFLTTRGVQCQHLGLDFRLPTCKNFFNIFHPYDPVAYRLEPLINPEATFPPVLIPHHKGRKRFHLEIKENISRVSANLKQGFIDAVRNTWTSINEFAKAHRTDAALEIGEETSESPASLNSSTQDSMEEVTEEDGQTSPVKMVNLGRLNSGRRIDYVLQEKPFEILNEYLFALSSHTTYWKSEDTVLLMMKEIYRLDPLVEAE